MKIKAGLLLTLAFSVSVLAGGNPEFVKFPEGYQESFTHYNTQNRANNEQVAEMYANEIAVTSAKNGELADGSVIVMEIHKPVMGEDGKPVAGADGVFQKAGLAAVAVMEKRDQWDDAYAAQNRTGNWGFAIYDAKGAPKENDLDCVTCHTPLSQQDFLFTFPKLTGK